MSLIVGMTDIYNFDFTKLLLRQNLPINYNTPEESDAIFLFKVT